MKLENEKYNLEQSGTFAEKRYTIEANAITFKILFKDMYSNIIKSCVREISSNALDSHIAAGKRDVPFHVHLPNHFEPWYSVTDTGVGMSDAFVQEEYTSFFTSNKRDSNDAVGCFGLGAKVPFAYTDNFTVRVRYNGVETTYNPLLNQEGLPTLMTLTKSPTKESNGTEVKFAVKSADFPAFIREAQHVFRWYKVRPIITGAANFSLPTEEYLHETKEYAVVKVKSYENFVIMGDVAYPLSEINLNLKYDSADENVRQLLNWGVRLYVKLGDVSLTPSREALNFDNRTIANLKKLLEESAIDFKKQMFDGVKAAKTLWEAQCKLYDISNSFLHYNGLTDKVFWNSQEIKPFVEVLRSKVNVKNYRKSYGAKYYESEPGSIECENTIPKYFNDIGLKGIRGLKKMAITDNIRSYTVIEEPATATPGTAKKWLKETGLDEVVKLASSIPDEHFQVNRQAITKKADKSLLYKFTPEKTGHWRKNGDDYWTAEQVDLKLGGIYIPISRFYWVKPNDKHGNEVTEHPKLKLTDLYRDILLWEPNFVLYGIIPSNMDKLKKYKNWTNLETYLDKLIEQNRAMKTPARYSWAYNSCHGDLLACTNSIQFHKKSPLGNFVKVIAEAKKYVGDEKTLAFRHLMEYRNLISYETSGYLNTAKQKIFNKYPLFNHIAFSQYSPVPQDILADYINLIESRNPLLNGASDGKPKNNGNKKISIAKNRTI